MLQKIRTVLIHNSHPGNVGASARAMKNMGLSQLYLVAPKKFPAPEATALAASAEDVLNAAKVVETLPEALQGCDFICGVSARSRNLAWPMYTPRKMTEKVISVLQHSSGDIALLYGSEQHGLTNEHLSFCHAQVCIPSNPEYASLNVSQAVQILSYELWLAFLAVENAEDEKENFEPASFEAMAGFYQQLETTVIQIGFLDPQQPGRLMPRLKRLFARARPDKIELNLLRGILTTLQKRV